jgi:hypothetical protein
MVSEKELAKHENEWVALSHDEKRIVAADKSMSKALAKARKKGEKHPVMHMVLSGAGSYIC